MNVGYFKVLQNQQPQNINYDFERDSEQAVCIVNKENTKRRRLTSVAKWLFNKKTEIISCASHHQIMRTNTKSKSVKCQKD